YAPYGDSRNSQGNLATDKLFTGQRLDGTGLYYYGARYYDPEIGRFISADTLVQMPFNPQSLNRYSYCLNNPLKYVDPSGLDAVMLFGSGMSLADYNEWELEAYHQWAHESGLVSGDEIFVILPDNDPERLYPDVKLFDVGPRLEVLESILPTLTNIKLVGFSEGGATVAKLLSNLASNPDTSLAQQMRKELKGAFILETPNTFRAGPLIGNYSPRDLLSLPDKLHREGFNIVLADIWNVFSVFHSPDPTEGWKDYSYPYVGPPLSHTDVIRPNNQHVKNVIKQLIVTLK
ncbi:MAG: RHS repeat-associated core domain-containing protein, partial [Dehalococcoidales bacterium]|nr:RHS repeat-associated core domain-containing protein [Dehalococcoidales bacterium]